MTYHEDELSQLNNTWHPWTRVPSDFQEIRREVDQIQTDEVKQRGAFLFALLASLVREKPLAVTKGLRTRY